ncbi:MAG: hypothetical protein N3A02_07840, partial [Rectinema sp.]|nr:hypothetical protein [Rectinema sp.]
PCVPVSDDGKCSTYACDCTIGALMVSRVCDIISRLPDRVIERASKVGIRANLRVPMHLSREQGKIFLPGCLREATDIF